MEAVVRRAQRGDARALEEVVAALAPYVGRICGAIALDDGDDAVQEAMIAIVRRLGTLREPAALHGWARTIATREALRVVRRGRTVAVDPADLEAVAVPDGATAVEVRAVLGALSPEHRAVLVLREVDGLSEVEAAEALGVSVGTVKSRAHRARAAFAGRWRS